MTTPLIDGLFFLDQILLLITMALISDFHCLLGIPLKGGPKFRIGFIIPEKYNPIEMIKKVFKTEVCVMETKTEVLGI